MKRHVLILALSIFALALLSSLSGCKTQAPATVAAPAPETLDQLNAWSAPVANPVFSCPLVYSFDGTAYKLDGELFTGAFFKNAERPDWRVLSGLRKQDDLYRLKLGTEQRETQYLDQVRLMVIDHPEGSRVYASDEGKLFTLNHPAGPRMAVDFTGTDMRRRVEASDNDYWLSNPLERNPEDPSQCRDGLILQYDRPEMSLSAALLLRLQNTYWANDLLRDVLELPGTDQSKWLDELNRSVEARQNLFRTWAREEMLRVYVWDETNWLPVGFVRDVGAATARDVVVEIDLSNIPGRQLKLKLECPPGLWMVNDAEVDYAYYTMPTRAQIVAPIKAVNSAGRDVSAALKDADNHYTLLQNGNDALYLEFPAPALRHGTERTVIVNAVGYYTPKQEAWGEPQTEFLQQLLQEPGKLQSFSLKTIQTKVQRYSRNMPLAQ